MFLPIQNLMALNKKYNHKIWILHKTIPEIDAYYPIILPTMDKVSAQLWEKIISWKMFAQHTQHREHKNFVPLVFFSHNALAYNDCLKGKNRLPFFAKKQRIAQYQAKNMKKNEQCLVDFLWKHQTFSADYLSKIQALCDVFGEKKMRKSDHQLVYRDTVYQTPVHAQDIFRKTEDQPLLEIKCFVEAKWEVLNLVVEDLTTFFFDVAVLVHNNDKRYKKYIGKNLILPIINKKIPILWADGVDTLTNNGIIRINPMISPQHFEKVKELWLPIDEQILDDNGNLCEEFVQKAVVSSEKKSENVGVEYNMLQNIDNIILWLREIGNLAEERTQVQQVPYSRISWSRLLKKIIPQLTLDFSEISEDFLSWIKENYWEEIALQLVGSETKILAQVNNPYWHYFAYRDGKVVVNPASLVWTNSALSFLLATLLFEQKIPETLPINDLIDLCFLIPDRDLDNIAEAFWKREEFLSQINTFKQSTEHEQISLLLDLENQHAWIKLAPDQLSLLLDPSLLLPKEHYSLGVRDEQVLNAFSLSLLRDELEKTFVFSTDESPQDLQILLLIDFLRWDKRVYEFVDLDFSFAQELWSEKTLVRAKEYGRDAITLLLSQQIKPTQESLDQAYGYLTHLRNLFKWLYEHQAFQDTTAAATAMDLWIFEQFSQISDAAEKNQKVWLLSSFDFIQKVQTFTRKDFSRYLECIKKLESNWDYHIAGTIFLQLIELLAPYLPGLREQISHFVGEKSKDSSCIDMSRSKDFKIYKLFDLIHKISEKKSELNLKKHQKILLFHRGSPETFNLLVENQAVLSSLLSVEQILMSERNEPIPANFSTFSLLDGELGVADATTECKKDELSLLEKEYRDKQTYLQTVKEVLIMLESSPVADPLKIDEKQDEYAMLKDQLLTLEIKIQKLKMQKKA